MCDWAASNQHIPELNSLSWIFMLQTNEISWSNLKLSINFVKSKLNIVLNEEELFGQFKLFEKLIKEKSTEWHSLTFEEKWISIFKSFKETNTDYSTLLKLIEFAFVLPGSNAVVERLFSLMNNYWTKSRNSLGIDTVEATLFIKLQNIHGKIKHLRMKLVKIKKLKLIS
ncbi:protein FAM200B-like [Aphis craccivora]|uniref:Protein FAM200B-like n=1 Tax=Aphis craccivora TaxID=307492 RepID=A0A6G0VXR0_APHCR|nr:protein FAM200B-like [Aphis craccivora]